MNVTETIKMGEPMPLIGSVSPAGSASVTIEWKAGPRSGTETVDLAPLIMTLKFYKPLRENPDLFATVQVIDDGAAIAWGDGSIDMAATSVERLAEEVMTAADFSAFLKRNNLTLDAAAGHLGISRRLVAYYVKGRAIPRYIALACQQLELRWSRKKDSAPPPKAAENPVAAAPDRTFYYVSSVSVLTRELAELWRVKGLYGGCTMAPLLAKNELLDNLFERAGVSEDLFPENRLFLLSSR